MTYCSSATLKLLKYIVLVIPKRQLPQSQQNFCRVEEKPIVCLNAINTTEQNDISDVCPASSRLYKLTFKVSAVRQTDKFVLVLH
jgi:hypothetical protein